MRVPESTWTGIKSHLNSQNPSNGQQYLAIFRDIERHINDGDQVFVVDEKDPTKELAQILVGWSTVAERSEGRISWMSNR